jgi:subtilisin family serine protease
VDRNGNHAEVSVVGAHAVLAAPAVEIASTDTRLGGNTGYRIGTGTSDATAIIAGAAALVRAKFPELSAAEVVHRLTATADDRGPPGRDDQYGYGIVNLVKALTAEVPPLQPSPTASANGGGTAAPPPAGRGGIPARTVVVIGALTLAALIAAASVVAVRSRRQ